MMWEIRDCLHGESPRGGTAVPERGMLAAAIPDLGRYNFIDIISLLRGY
jgi:hypothetical protein